MDSGEARDWMWSRRRPVFPTHPAHLAQGMGWVQLVRNSWAWDNLGRLNPALGMRFIANEVRGWEQPSQEPQLWSGHPGQASPWSQAACPSSPAPAAVPTSASWSLGKQEGIAFRESEALSPNPHSCRTPTNTFYGGSQTLRAAVSVTLDSGQEAPRSRGQAVIHSPSALISFLLQACSSEPALLCLSALL